jgi:hypothetical protein
LLHNILLLKCCSNL